MTADRIAALLEPIQNRLNAASDGPWVTALSGNRKWALVLKDAGTADEWIVAKSNDDDNAEFIANAPTDTARLLAAVQAVAGIADINMTSEHGDPAFIQGWEAAIEEVNARIIEALEG